MTRTGHALATSVLGLISAVSIAAQSTPPESRARRTTLGVAGAVNATPSVTVRGRSVAAVWTATKDGSTDVYIAMSSNGGATFAPPRRVNDQNGDASANNEQPPRAVIAGHDAQAVTVLWSRRNEGAQRMRRDAIRMARSTDGGRTFAPARFIHDAALSGARGWESATAGPGDSIHAVWLDGRDAERKMTEAAAHSGMAHKGQPPQDIYHGTIAPDGRITEGVIATGVCFCCKTAVAADGRGTVYAAWRHIFPGSMRDIAFAKSTDGGRHFDRPVRVSEDKWELNGCPEDGPSLAIDAAGVIHIVWATLVQDGEPHKALFYATSRDGATFSARAPIPVAASATPGHPQLALAADGAAAVVWDEVVAGQRRVAFARKPRAGAFQPPQVLSGEEPATHPVIARADGGFVIAWTTRPTTTSGAEPSIITIRRVP